LQKKNKNILKNILKVHIFISLQSIITQKLRFEINPYKTM